tara:strand:- start:207 stop:461 length:255 start_codon:yes stop_codon:yes gene_type:complete
MKRDKLKWSKGTKELIKELNLVLILNNKNWHELKHIPERRAAELLGSALAQIINQGDKEDIKKLIEQALKWIKGELKDPGCSSH